MSRLRDDNPMVPSHAAIVRQQAARLEEPAHLGAGIDDRFGAAGTEHGQPLEQQDCWVICDQEEPLLYI
jgi:hypothetical protein